MIKLTLWTRRREGCCTFKHSQEKYILCDLLNKNSDKVNTLLSTNCSMPIPLASATSCRGFQQFWQQLAKKVWPLFRAQFLQIQDAWGLCCMYSRFQISPQVLNKKIFYWAGHFLSPLFLPFLQLFLSECACVLRIIMCFRFQVQLQLLNLFSRTLHYTSEFLAFVTRGRRPCQCLSEDTPAYQEVKGYSLETLPVLREMLRLKICVCWCVFHRESRSKGRERPVIIMFNADNISSGIFWGPLYFLFVSLCSKERLFSFSRPLQQDVRGHLYIFFTI